MGRAELQAGTAASARAAVPHLIGFVLPPIVVLSVWLGGAWTFLPLLIVYGVLPVADRKPDPRNPSPAEAMALDRNPWFRAVTWAWVPVQLALLAWALSTAARGTLAPIDTLGLAVSLGVTTGGIGITFAHELIHRPGRVERALGEALLATVCYMHFAIEHVQGHHRYVGTPRDPATARLGDASYAFLLRSVLGGARSAWALERARLRKRGLSTWTPRNRMLWYGSIEAVLLALVYWLGGWAALGVFLFQAGVAVSLLELINYVEHYGLVRREVAPGKYEPIAASHAWDSSYRVSNWILINLARHADHHLTAAKRYQVLHTLDEAPQLPAGYSAMILLALVPPLWRRIMDPRVIAWRDARSAAAPMGASR